VTTPERSAPKTYERQRFHQFENVMTTVLTRLGVIPRSYVLTTVGRRSGQERRNPVTVVELDGTRWLVAPYGVVPWVLNARAAGEVRLTRRFSTTRFAVREVGPVEAGPVLKAYVTVASVPRPYFVATVDDPPEAFGREAAAHPVMQLVPVAGD
jgi:deazaflavin-dependent oxidoreductase (nitroreductase family)